MRNLFHRSIAFALRHPIIMASVVIMAVVTLPSVVHAQGTGACYSAGYGSACDSVILAPDWLVAAMALLMFAFFGGMGWVSWT